MAMKLVSTKFIGLHILPDFVRSDSEWVNIHIIGTAIVSNNVSGMDLRAIDSFVAHTFSNVTIILADHSVSGVRVEIPCSKSVCDLAEPGLSTNHLRVHVLVSNDVHIVPPTVEQIVIPLLVHTHIHQVHRGQVASSCRADHLTIVDDT